MVDFNSIHLSIGSHESRCDTDGNATVCAMELVAWMGDEPHSDTPTCVSPEIAAYVRILNDAMSDSTRQRLKPYLPRMMNTEGDGKAQTRTFMLADAAVRTFAPIALDAAGLTGVADNLRNLPPITDAESAKSAAGSAWSVESAAVWSARAAAAADSAESASWSARSAWSAESAESAAAAWSAAAADSARAWDAALETLNRILPI